MTAPADEPTPIPLASHASPVTQAGFTMIPNAVMLRRDLTAEAKLVYGYLKHLCWRSNGDEAASPREIIARDLNLSEKLVTKSMQILGRAPTIEGDPSAPPLVLSIRRGQGKTNLYRVNEPGYVPEIPDLVDSATDEQRVAWAAVHAALQRGALVRLPCEVAGCRETDTDAHHEDYSRPLAVNWLCREHHRQYHLFRDRSGEAISAFLEKPSQPELARARSVSEPKKTNEEQNPPKPPTLEDAPEVVLAGGRNVPLDVLLEVCEVANVPTNRRAQRAAIVLNGRRHKTTGKLLTPGIRHAFWDECCQQAGVVEPKELRAVAGGMERLVALQADPVRFAALLADRIRFKAECYRRKMPDVPCTPEALLRWWHDVGTLQATPGYLTVDQIANRDA